MNSEGNFRSVCSYRVVCVRNSSQTLEESRVLIKCLHVRQSSVQSVMKTICELLIFKNKNKINSMVSLHFP